MTTLLAKPPTTAATPISVTNDGFFPSIALGNVRERTRLDGTITDPRLHDAVSAAMISVNKQLDNYKHIQIERGYDRLVDVPSTSINQQSVLITLYERAVLCTVQADLNERYSDFDSTDIEKRDEKISDRIADTQRRNAQWAINDLIGRPRATIELI
jgi:hypothetical protein